MAILSTSKSKKTAAGILGSLLLLVMLFSAFFIAAETGHDCEGEDCPICVCVQQCENTLHRIGDGNALLTVSVMPIICAILSSILFVPAFFRGTPVSRKIRLNN